MKTRFSTAIRLAAFSLLLGAPSLVLAQFNYITINGTISITGYTGPGRDVNIPGTINGLRVISIEPLAFSGRSILTSVTIPNTVTTIGFGAFDSCTGLTNVTIGNSVTWIGDRAFYVCTKLTSVTIPNSVTHIGDRAFWECSSLKSVTIPNGVTNIEGVFSFCGGLTNVTIPNSVTSIGGWAFVGCTSLTSVTIPDSVTHIGGSAFDSCTGLTSVTIPNSVTSIDHYAFQGCSSMTNLTIPDSVTRLEFTAFDVCTSLTAVFFEGNAPTASMFYGVHNATIYYLPGAEGWGATYGYEGLPTALWVRPEPVILRGSVGIQNNGFGFTISWATNASVVVEGSTNLANPDWLPLATNTLAKGTSYFSDPEWMKYSGRFYRIRSP